MTTCLPYSRCQHISGRDSPRDLIVEIRNPENRVHFEDIEAVFDIDPLPSAVIATDEIVADLLLASCARRGIRVPEDLSVAACQDLIPHGHRVPLTAPDSAREMSRAMTVACDMLIRAIRGEKITESHVTFETRLIGRASTASPARLFIGDTQKGVGFTQAQAQKEGG